MNSRAAGEWLSQEVGIHALTAELAGLQVRLIAELERSGQRHAVFAARKGIRLHTLRTWLYRLRRESRPESVLGADHDDAVQGLGWVP